MDKVHRIADPQQPAHPHTDWDKFDSQECLQQDRLFAMLAELKGRQTSIFGSDVDTQYFEHNLNISIQHPFSQYFAAIAHYGHRIS